MYASFPGFSGTSAVAAAGSLIITPRESGNRQIVTKVYSYFDFAAMASTVTGGAATQWRVFSYMFPKLFTDNVSYGNLTDANVVEVVLPSPPNVGFSGTLGNRNIRSIWRNTAPEAFIGGRFQYSLPFGRALAAGESVTFTVVAETMEVANSPQGTY